MAGSDRVPPLQEAHDGERARAEVDAAVGVNEVELRAGHGDEGLLGGGQWRCGVLILFRLWEEVLGELVRVDGGAQQGRGGGGRGWCGFGEEAAWSNTEWRAGLLRTTDGGRDKVAVQRARTGDPAWLRTGRARNGVLSGPSFSRTHGDKGRHFARPIRAFRVAA
jgi:hypothetical protein